MNSELGQTFPPPSPIDPLLRPRGVQRDGETPRPAQPPRRLWSSRPSGRHRRRGKRLNGAVLAIASVVGVWFGIAAPAISPVAPQPVAAAPVAAAPVAIAPVAVAPVAAAPVAIAPVAVAHEVAVAAVVTPQARHGHDGHR